jgi:hypothetical protein
MTKKKRVIRHAKAADRQEKLIALLLTVELEAPEPIKDDETGVKKTNKEAGK